MSSKPEAVITRVRASNFRSIESLDLQLGPLNVLVGQNGVGKSNIIDVLRFVRDSLNRSVDQALLDRGGMGAVRRLVPHSPASDVTIELHCVSGRHVVEYSFSLARDRRAEYRVRAEHLHASDSESGETILNLRLNGGRWARPGLSRTRFQGSYSDSELHLPKTWMLHSGPLGEDALIGVVQATHLLRNMSFYNINPESLRSPQQIVAESPFDEKGRNLAAVLRAIRKGNGPELIDIEGALTRLVDGLRTYEIHNVGSYLITKLLYEFPRTDSRDPMRLGSDLAQESDGTLRILSILAALYQQPARPLVVIEEPEINIHPGALGVLADLLKEASLRSQILVTTHNPDLIEHFEPDVLRVVEKSDGVTHAGPVAHDQQEAIRKMLFSTAEIMKMEGLRRETAGV